MPDLKHPARIASYVLMGLGLLLIAAGTFIPGALRLAQPLVFWMLGGALILAVSAAGEKWRWAAVLYLPATLLLGLGLVFLLNLLTGDWNSWAYAWMLPLAFLGAGLLLTNYALGWHPAFNVAGASLAAGGLVLFVLFGALAGGPFIQLMAPLLLIAGGGLLFWLRPETVLPGRFLRRPRAAAPVNAPASAAAVRPVPAPLVEPLSARELEVLRMINLGLSNQQIAERLTVAPSTVKTHINNLYGKLAVQTRVQAIQRGRELGLLE